MPSLLRVTEGVIVEVLVEEFLVVLDEEFDFELFWAAGAGFAGVEEEDLEVDELLELELELEPEPEEEPEDEDEDDEPEEELDDEPEDDPEDELEDFVGVGFDTGYLVAP